MGEINDLRARLASARTWPVKEAHKIIERVANYAPDKPIILEMGFGPSALPHLGTLTELIRTEMVGKVLRTLQDRPVITIAFVDDMDGCRKIAPNLPNQDMLAKYLGYPLCAIPDPYNKYRSFSEHNLSYFKDMAIKFGYDIVEYVPTAENQYSLADMLQISDQGRKIVLIRSSDMYNSGSFDESMKLVVQNYKKILNVILPQLGEKRRATYSPFMPISPKTGKVLENEVIGYDLENNSVEVNEDGENYKVQVTGGNCKLQWKIDFGMRWFNFGVDYEIGGKDIDIGTVPVSSKVCRILGQIPPINMMYELFLAEDGTRISKTKGNGITLEEFVNYVHLKAINRFMYVNPTVAKRLDIEKIPTYTDAYIKDLQDFVDTEGQNMESPIWYSDVTDYTLPNITATMALTLIRNIQIHDLESVIDFFEKKIEKFNQFDLDIVKKMHAFWLEEVDCYEKMLMPAWLIPYVEEMIERLSDDPEDIQVDIYELGNLAINQQNISSLREWFTLLYKCFLGSDSGPRIGNFFSMYGIDNTKKMLEDLVNRAKEHAKLDVLE